MFKLPKLPYKTSDFGPWLSAESFQYHYGKHHKGYIDKVNSFVEAENKQENTLEEIVLSAKGEFFDNAAQAWNHTFFWHGITPDSSRPNKKSELHLALGESFGPLDEFKNLFTQVADAHFGSGWVWLTKDKFGKLEIFSTSDARNPMTESKVPLLTCDLWEHAYYIDHRNARQKFVKGILKHLNWEFAERNFQEDSYPNMSQYMQK